MGNLAMEREEWEKAWCYMQKPQDIHKEHQFLAQQYLNSGLSSREAVSKAWDILLDKILNELRK